MDCALWLNKHKVFSADEIPSNFDIAAIRGYFLGGSLIPWLKEHGGEKYAAALEDVSPASDKLNDILAEIFGQKRNNTPVHHHDEQLIAFIDYMKSGGNAAQSSHTGSNGAYTFGSMRSMGGSYNAGSYSFGFGSYKWGSYNFGSYKGFNLWEWEWEWYLSSFRKRGSSGSYSFGSFNVYGTGSFNLSGFGSMRFMGGSFNMADILGSYRGIPLSNSGSGGWISPDEYDEIMYRTLGICPLDRYGYGIHII